MNANGNNGDARITRSIVVEARIAPNYGLMHLDAVELIKFEADYARYVNGATQEAGSVRTKVSCFNERLLKFLAKFKIPGKPAWSDITDEELQEVINDSLLEANARRGDTREIEVIAGERLVWDLKLKTSDQRVEYLFVTWCDFLEAFSLDEYFSKKGNEKKVGNILINAVKPGALRVMIQRRVDQEGRECLKDADAMMTFILEEARKYDEVALAEKEHSSAPGKKMAAKSDRAAESSYSTPQRNHQQATGGSRRAEPREAAYHGATAKSSSSRKCLGCNSTGHMVNQCRLTTPERRQALLVRFHEERRSDRMRLRSGREVRSGNGGSGAGRAQAKSIRVALMDDDDMNSLSSEDEYLMIGDQGIMTRYVVDDGADRSFMSHEMAAMLLSANDQWSIVDLGEEAFGVELAVDGHDVVCSKYMMLKYVIHMNMGFIEVPLEPVYILDCPMKYFLVGRPALISIGVDVPALLQDIAARSTGVTASARHIARGARTDVERRNDGTAVNENDHDTVTYGGTSVLSEEDLAYEVYEEEVIGSNTDDEFNKAIQDMLDRATSAGFPQESMELLINLVEEYRDVFRIFLLRDPPANVRPWVVHAAPGAVPVRCSTRVYTPLKREFMERFTHELMEAGMLRRNNASRWSSAAHPVSKPGKPGEYRLTVDYKAVNMKLVATAYPSPVLETLIQMIGLSCFFATLDLFKGFWQFPLDESSQDFFSFQTPHGVFTPNRVMQGSTTGTSACQAGLEEILGGLLWNGVLAYVDDMFLYSSTISAHVALLRSVLHQCQEYGLKLNAKKCNLFQTEARWVGRIFSKDGVRNDPVRLEALQAYPVPTRGDQLQSFLASINWMRSFLIDYTNVTQPLYALMETSMKGLKSRKAVDVKKIDLVPVWTAEHAQAWENTRHMLKHAVTLAVVDPAKVQCVYTDASMDCWSVVITQVEPHLLTVPLEEQQHQPLMFLTGRFAGASANWPIVDKEGFAILMAVKRCGYLLASSKPFHIFTDHKNLVNIFSNDERGGVDTPRYRADRLARWAMVLRDMHFVLHHIRGADNILADLFSRFLNPHYVEPEGRDATTQFAHKAVLRSIRRSKRLRERAIAASTAAGDARAITAANALGDEQHIAGSHTLPEVMDDTRVDSVEGSTPSTVSLEQIQLGEEVEAAMSREPINASATYKQAAGSTTGKKSRVRQSVRNERTDDFGPGKSLVLAPADDSYPTIQEVATAQQAVIPEEGPSPEVCKVSLERLWFPTGSEGKLVRALAHMGKLFIPDVNHLRLRILVIVHSGIGHRGFNSTYRALRSRFWWDQMGRDVKSFIKQCLHCRSTSKTGNLIRRYVGVLLHADAPGGLLHFDFCFVLKAVEGSKHGWSWVLILKDDFSRLIEIVACMVPTAEVVVTALLDWFKRHGIVQNWMCDQATTNINEVMSVVATRLNCEQHFNVVDSSHTLGTMERVNRDFRAALQAIVSEWTLDIDDWVYCLPALQHGLNTAPLEPLGGLCAMEVHSGRKPVQPLDLVLQPAHTSTRLVAKPVDALTVVKVTEDLRASLEEMNTKVVTPAQRSAIARDDVYQVPVNWSVGDFVMWSKPLKGPTNKTKGVWKGPYRVVRAVSDTVWEVQDLVQPDLVKPVHSTRLSFYADSAMEVTHELLEIAQHNDLGFVIDTILELKEEDNLFKLKVKWLGLEEEDSTWEMLDAVYEDVAVRVNQFLRTKKTDLHKRATAYVKQLRKQRK